MLAPPSHPTIESASPFHQTLLIRLKFNMMHLNRLRPTPQQRNGLLKRRCLPERHMRLDAIPAHCGQKHAGLPTFDVLALDFLDAPAARAAVEPFGVLVAQPRELGPAG